MSQKEKEMTEEAALTEEEEVEDQVVPVAVAAVASTVAETIEEVLGDSMISVALSRSLVSIMQLFTAKNQLSVKISRKKKNLVSLCQLS